MTANAAQPSVLETRIAELTLRFMNGLPGRLASITEALSRLETDPEAIAELARQFHALAGTAGTYQVGGIAILAREAETICAEPNAPRRERLRYLVSAMQETLPHRSNLSEETMRGLLEAAFDGVCIHDFERIVEVNAACAQMAGYTMEEMIGMPLQTFVDASKLERILSDARAGVNRHAARIRRKDGTFFDAELSAAQAGSEGRRVVAIRDVSERKEMERALRDREENFRILCQAAFDGILIHEDGVITAVNDKCATMFRTTTENLIGRNILELTDPSYRDAIAQRVRERRSEPFESVALRVDGTRMPVELCGVSKEGSPMRIVALRELTSAHEAQAQLVESELRYRELLESNHDLVCEHDLEGNVLFANALAAHALEIPHEALRGMNVRDAIAPEHRAEFDAYLATIRTAGVAEGLMTILTRSGKRRVWHYQNTLHRSGVDRPVVRGRARDVTEREEALRALHRSERRFRSIIENASDMILICDPSGVISYHSPATTRILGYELDELEGRHYRDFVHPEERSATQRNFERQIENPDRVLSGDFRVAHKDGSWRWVSITSSCVVNAGNVQSIIVNARDITDRRLLEARLEQANRLTSLGRLTATVAHEFNNVLMSMQPFADLMQRPNVKPDVVAKGARHIASSIARGKRVAMDMLRFTRPAEPNLARIDLQEWWERFAPCMVATTGDNVRISWTCPPALAISGDAAQLSQVFSNLISNARDAMPHGGNLTIRCRVPRAGETFAFGVVDRAATFVQISVQDTGAGMPEHVMRHVFDPLFTTKQNTGTGLGLAVAHQVVTRHGGFIFVESTEHVGTTFHMFLPLAGEAVAIEESIEPAEPAVKSRRVLLVEDEPGIREGVADTLNERGIVVAAVEAGRDAIPAMTAFGPQLAIIDIGLPDIDGLDLGRIIRKLDPNVKIIFASGHGDASRVVGECAPARFLQKPFAVRELLEVIAALEREETR